MRFSEAVIDHVVDGCAHVSKDELTIRLAAC